MSTYEIIYADPPWDYKGKKQHDGKYGVYKGGAINHYPTMTLDELKRFDAPAITAENALLFMWTSSPHLDQAIDLMKAWQFKWATVGFVWDKQKHNPGFYTMSQCELCLIGKKGKIPSPRGARNIRQLVSVERGRHSEKPVEVRQRIEKVFPSQSKIELFARSAPKGWHVFGNEVESNTQLSFV